MIEFQIISPLLLLLVKFHFGHRFQSESHFSLFSIVLLNICLKVFFRKWTIELNFNIQAFSLVLEIFSALNALRSDKTFYQSLLLKKVIQPSLKQFFGPLISWQLDSAECNEKRGGSVRNQERDRQDTSPIIWMVVCHYQLRHNKYKILKLIPVAIIPSID